MPLLPVPLPPPGTTVGDDVACLRCGYNLRALDARGLCPECGYAIRVSILAREEARRRAPPLREADPRWLRELSEGLFAALAVFALMVLLGFAPPWAYEWKSPQRTVTLGVACAAWVLSWFAAWKLGAREPQSPLLGKRRPRALRVIASIYLAVPFFGEVTQRYMVPTDVVVAFVVVCLPAGIVAAAMWFVVIGQLAERAGARILPVEAWVLAVLSALGCVATYVPSGHAPDDSLSQLLRAHLTPLGATEWFREINWSIVDARPPSWIEWIGLLIPVWGAVVCVRLLVRLRRAARMADS